MSNIPLKRRDHVSLFRGKEKACKTGCGYSDFAGYGGDESMEINPYAIVYGKGHNIKELDANPGPFIVNGPCAVAELKDYFTNRKKREKVRIFYINEHEDLAQYLKYILKAGKIKLGDFSDDLPIPMERWMEILKLAYQNGVNFHSAI